MEHLPNPLHGAIEWVAQCYPAPTSKDFTVQVGVHVEEIAEQIEEFSSEDPATAYLLDQARKSLRTLSEHLKAEKPQLTYDRAKLLKEMCDGVQTTAAVCHAASFDLMGAMDEVVKSNFSKFEDGKPVFQENGKVGKGVHTRKADVTPFS